jgi:hypothetical protein
MSPDLAGKSQIDENEKKFELVAKSQAPRDDKPATGNRATSLHGQQLSHGPMPPSQWQQNLNANTANQRMMFQQVPAPPAPAANELSAAVTVSAQSSPAAAPAVGGLMPEKQVQKFDTLAMNARSAAPLPSTRASTGAEVARAKDAEPPANAPKAQATGAYDVSESSTSNFSPSGSLVAESARWTINSMGGLQRSFDQGKTWQSVDVANSVQDSSGMNLQLAMKTARAKPTAKEKADAKTKPIVFRAVAANGPDVWAGGSESTLFHSMDSGDHWIRIQPSWRGVQLSGDILSLQFADPQHGRIVTSTAEIWNTADAGQTWDKQ